MRGMCVVKTCYLGKIANPQEVIEGREENSGMNTSATKLTSLQWQFGMVYPNSSGS